MLSDKEHSKKKCCWIHDNLRVVLASISVLKRTACAVNASLFLTTTKNTPFKTVTRCLFIWTFSFRPDLEISFLEIFLNLFPEIQIFQWEKGGFQFLQNFGESMDKPNIILLGSFMQSLTSLHFPYCIFSSWSPFSSWRMVLQLRHSSGIQRACIHFTCLLGKCSMWWVCSVSGAFSHLSNGYHSVKAATWQVSNWLT